MVEQDGPKLSVSEIVSEPQTAAELRTKKKALKEELRAATQELKEKAIEGGGKRFKRRDTPSHGEVSFVRSDDGQSVSVAASLWDDFAKVKSEACQLLGVDDGLGDLPRRGRLGDISPWDVECVITPDGASTSAES